MGKFWEKAGNYGNAKNVLFDIKIFLKDFVLTFKF
jgi:hypothetical protein